MELVLLRSLMAFVLLSTAVAVPAEEPAAGTWAEHTQEIAGGLAIRTVDAETCYAEGKSAALLHVTHLAQRLIDASCTGEAPDSGLDDATRYVLHCGGAEFGDGFATVSPSGDRSMRIDVVFHNNATGLEMEYLVDSSWRRPECGVSH